VNYIKTTIIICTVSLLIAFNCESPANVSRRTLKILEFQNIHLTGYCPLNCPIASNPVYRMCFRGEIKNHKINGVVCCSVFLNCSESNI
jgi:hypothetical protein